MLETMMRRSVLCESCRHADFIGSTTRLRCGAQSGEVVDIKRIKGEQVPDDACWRYERSSR